MVPPKGHQRGGHGDEGSRPHMLVLIHVWLLAGVNSTWMPSLGGDWKRETETEKERESEGGVIETVTNPLHQNPFKPLCGFRRKPFRSRVPAPLGMGRRQEAGVACVCGGGKPGLSGYLDVDVSTQHGGPQEQGFGSPLEPRARVEGPVERGAPRVHVARIQDLTRHGRQEVAQHGKLV